MKMRKGFTLVESLIVIVIIGILAGAMMLTTGGATDSAKASRIISELRNLKGAVAMVMLDSPDAVPASFDVATLAKYMDRTETQLEEAGVTTNPVEGGGTGYEDRWFIKLEAKGVDAGVEKKLASQAKKAGIYSDNKCKDYSTGNTIYMIVR